MGKKLKLAPVDPTLYQDDPGKKLPLQPVDPSLYGGVSDNQSNLDVDKYKPYLKTVFNNPGLDEARAQAQTAGDLIKGAFGQAASEVIFGTLEGTSYLLDFEQMKDKLKGDESEYTNWFAKKMEEVQEQVKGAVPIHTTKEAQTSFAPGDATWWASNAPSIASSLSLLIPAAGATKLAGGLTKSARALAGLGELGEEAAQIAKGLTMASYSRYMENTMEASQTFQSTFQKAKTLGFSDDQAKQKAGEAASNTWNANSALWALDALEFTSLLKFAGKAGKGAAGGTLRTIGEFAKQQAGEGVEEIYQGISSKEAENSALDRNNPNEAFGERLGDYLQDPEVQTAGFFGTLGGAVTTGGILALEKLEQATGKEKVFNADLKKIVSEGVAKERDLYFGDKLSANLKDDKTFARLALNHIATGQEDKLRDTFKQLQEDPATDGDARESISKKLDDLDFLVKEVKDLREKDMPSEVKDSLLINKLDHRNTSRNLEQANKEYEDIYQDMARNGQIQAELIPLKKAQIAVGLTKLDATLAKTEQKEELTAKAKKAEVDFSQAFEAAKVINPSLKLTDLSAVNDDKLYAAGSKAVVLENKKENLNKALAKANTTEGQKELKKEAAIKKEVATTKSFVAKEDLTPADIESQLTKVQTPESHDLLQARLEKLQEQNADINKQKTADELDHYTDEHLNPEVDINPELSPEPPIPEEPELDVDPFANVDPATLAAFGQVKPQDAIIEKISDELEKKQPKPIKEQAKKAEKIKNEYLESQTAKTWFKEFESHKEGKEWILNRDAEGYPIEQQYYDKKGDKVPAHKVFASDNHGIVLADTPLVKEGDHVLLKHENEFEYTYSQGFKPTGPENQVINIYWVNEDGSLRHDKPLNQLISTDNNQLTPEQAEINKKIRQQVYANGGELRTRIISKNIGEAKRGNKLNSLGILEFDYFNNQFQKLPFNPVFAGIDQNGNIVFSGDTVAKLPKDYKDKVEVLQNSFPELRGSVLVARQSPDGTLRVEVLNERVMSEGEITYVKANITEAFRSNDFSNLDQVFYIQNHSVGVYRDTDSRTKRHKTPDLFKMDRKRIHRIEQQLAIPIASGKLQGWAVVEKNDIQRFLKGENSNIKRYWMQGGKMVKMTNPLDITEQLAINKVYNDLIDNKQRNISHEKLNSELPYLDPATQQEHASYYDFLKSTNTLQTKLRGSVTPSYGQDTSYSYGQAALYLDPNQNNLEVSVTPEEEIKVTKSEPLSTIDNFTTALNITHEKYTVKSAQGKVSYIYKYHPTGFAREVAGDTIEAAIEQAKQSLISKKKSGGLNPDEEVLYELMTKSETKSESKSANRKPSFTKKKYKLATTPAYKFKTLGDQELNWFKHNYGEEFLSVAEHVDKFVAENGKEAFGVYYNALISVAEYATEGTIYHEAGHFVFDPQNQLISEKMREKVLDEASKIYKIARSHDQLGNPELNDPLESVPTINGKQKVFVYGTLLNDTTRKQALGEHVEASDAVVPEESRANVKDYPDIAPKAGTSLNGKTLELSKEQIDKLDKWETDYSRQVVKLSSGERAFVYNMKPDNLERSVVDDQLTGDQLLEEKLMEDFETYKISDGQSIPEVPSASNFFAKLLYMIKKLLGFKSQIQKLFETIDDPNINKFQREKLVANRLLTSNGELKFKLAPGFINSEQEADAILSFKTEAMNIIYAAVQKINQVGNVLTQPGRLDKILEEVRAKFRTEGFNLMTKEASKRTQADIDRLSTLWATGVMEDSHVDDANIDYVGTWNDNQYGEFIDKGFKSKVIESLTDLGFVVKVNADLLELHGQDEAERLYDIDHTLLNPSNSISNRVKLLLHSIPMPTFNSKGEVTGYEHTHLGTIKPLDFKAVDARLALKLADALNPYTRLGELAKVDPIAKVIFDKLNNIKAKGDLQTFKEVLVKYRRDTVDKKTILHKTERLFIPIQERDPSGAEFYDKHTSTLIDANRNSVFRSIISDWREEAIRTNFITYNDTVTNKLTAVNNLFAKLKANKSAISYEEERDQFKHILKEMGVIVAPEVWKELDTLPKKNKKFQLDQWVFGERARSLESLLTDTTANNQSPFMKETGTILEDLAKASAVYNQRVKTGAYLNENGELEYPINTPSYLSELNNTFENSNLTEEFIQKYWQDDFYKSNEFLLALRDPKLRSGIRLSMLAAVRDRNEDAKMFADRTEIDSIISRFTAFSSNNDIFSNFFIGTPADKAKNPMMSLPRKKGADALSFFKKVLEGTIDSELVRINKQGGKFLYVPELNDVANLKSSLSKGEISPEDYKMARIQAAKVLDQFIEVNFNKFLDFLEENDVISTKEEKGKRSITNKRIPQGVIPGSTETFLKEFFFNDTAWRLEMSKVFMGDFAFYKGQNDYFKRAYQLVTPGYKGFVLPGEANTITRGIYPKQMKFESPEIQSLVALGLSQSTADQYKKGINKTDAQSVATIHGYRKLADSLGLWSSAHEDIYNIAWGKGLTAKKGIQQAEQSNQITTDEAKRLRQSLRTLTLQPLKPFQFNDKEVKVNGQNTIIKEQYKDSITPLIPEVLQGHTGYSDLHEFMMANNFDVMSAEDTVKVGLSDVVDFSKPVEERHKKIANLDSIRYPQLLPEKSKEEVSGTQFHKLVMGDISDTHSYTVRNKKVTGKQVKELYQKMWNDKVREASESLQKKLGVDETFTLSQDPVKRKEQFIKLQLMLKEELSTRDLNENYEDAIELVRTQIDTIDFALPLSFPQLGEKFQGILTNVFKKKIFKEGTKSRGYSAVNLADFGVGRVDELKYIRNEGGEIAEAEIGLPIDYISKIGLKATEHYSPSTNRIYWDKLNDNQKKALQFIIYRIPTSNKSSMLPVRVVMITPSTLNNVVMIPGELTLQMGLDFDVDKSQLISRVIDKEGKIDKDHTDSRLFDIYWSVLTNSAHLNAMLTPLSTQRLEDIRDKYKSMDILSEESSSPFFTIQADTRAESKNREEKRKVGKASRAATAHSVFNTIPKELMNTRGVHFGLHDGEKEQILGKDVDHSGTLISENLGVMQQAALDAAKTPLLALFNITDTLMAPASTYLLFGKNLDTTIDFFMQPIVRKWSEVYIQQDENARAAFEQLGVNYPEIGSKYDHHLKNPGADRSFTGQDLKIGLTSKIGDNPSLEAHILIELHYLLDLSKQMTNFTNVVSLETMNDATSIESLLVVQNQVRQATDPDQAMYLDHTIFDLSKAPIEAKRVAAFYKHGIEDGITYAGQFYPTTSMPYRYARQNVLDTLKLFPNVELYKKVDQFLNYHILQGDSKLAQAIKNISPSKAPRVWSYVNEEKSMYNHIQKMTKKFPTLLDHTDPKTGEKVKGNELIKNLRNQTRSRNEADKRLSLVGVKNTDDNTKTEIINAWSDLFNAENEEVRQLAHDLATYSIFTSAFTYHTASFIDLIPQNFWKKGGIDQIWKDTLNNPQIDQEAFLVDFVRHKYKSIKYFPQFYLDYKNQSKSILKSSIKQDKEGLITSFVINENVYGEENLPPRFVTVRGSLYENNPANFVHYKLLQPAGSRYLYEVSADGRKESVHPDNKGLGSNNPFKNRESIKQYPLLSNVPEGQNEFIAQYLPQERNEAKDVLDKLIAEETNEQTLHTLHTLQRSINKINTPVEVREVAGKLGVFEVMKTFEGTTSTIKINPNANVESPSQMRHVLTHELVHAFTVGVLQNPQTEQEINFSRNVERLANESSVKDKYEFIAELASNPAFRQSLKKKDLWSRVLRLIRKVLGQKDSYDQLLDQMYSVVDNAESLQSITPGEFALKQEKEKKEPKKQLDALEKAISQLEALKRKTKENRGKAAANPLSVTIDRLKKLAKIDRNKAVIEYLITVSKHMDELKKAYNTMAKSPDKLNPKILNPMKDQLISYDLLDTFASEIHTNPEKFVPEGGNAGILQKTLSDLRNDVFGMKSKINALVIDHIAYAALQELRASGDKTTTFEQLRDSLKVADRDISLWSRWTSSFGTLRDKFIKVANNALKAVEHKAYRDTQEDLYRTTKKKETASAAVYEDRWVRRVVSYDSVGMFKALNDYEDWLKKNGKDKGALADKFSPVINKDSLKQDSTGVEFISPWSKEGKEILAIKEGSENYPLRQFYETFVLGYLKSQEQIKLPSMRPGLRIPTIGRTLLDGFVQEKGITQKLNLLGEQFANSFIERFDDSEYQQVNQHGKPKAGLALRYTSRQDGEEGRLTKKEVSLDVASTIGLFMYEMNKREGMLNIIDSLELTKQVLGEREVMKTKGSEGSLSPETRGIPLANGEYETKGGLESNAYRAMSDLLDRKAYGVVKKREGETKLGEKKISHSKTIDAFLRFTGMRIMLFKLAIPLTNWTMGELTLLKEIVGGNILNKRNYLAGQSLYAKNVVDLMKDTGRREKKTPIGRLFTFFNPMEGLPAVSHIGTDTNRMRHILHNVMSTGGASAEFKNALTAFGATLDKFKVLDPSGKQTSSAEGIEVSNEGKLTLKKGYKYLGKDGIQYEKGKTELSDRDIDQISGYTLRVYHILNGVYNQGDKSASNAYVVGRVVGFMRNWLEAGIAARWYTKDFDTALMQENEGHYVSALIAFKNIYGEGGWLQGSINNLKMLTWMGVSNPENLLLPSERELPQEEKDELINMRQAGIRKTLFELYGIALIGVIMAAAFGGDDDEDSYAKYMLARVRRELMTFINPLTAWDVLRSPTVALSSIESFAAFTGAALNSVYVYGTGQDQPIMERGPGKGMTKVEWRFRKATGLDFDTQLDDLGLKTRTIINGGFK